MHSSDDVPLFLLAQLIDECKHLEINKGNRCTSSYRTNKLVDKQAVLLRSIRDRRKREHTWYADRVCDRVYHDPLTGRVHRFNFNLRVSVAAILVYNVSFNNICILCYDRTSITSCKRRDFSGFQTKFMNYVNGLFKLKI